MNQSAIVLGGVAGLICLAAAAAALLWLGRARLRPRAQGSDAAASTKVLAQWPTTALVLDPLSNGIVAANPAALRSLGYSQDELSKLPFTQLFSRDGIDPGNFIARLREATSSEPFEMRQHCKDGSVRTVEATCYSLSLGERAVLAVAVHDVTERRNAQTQLMERHQQLDHLANHDHLTGLPNRLYLAAHLPNALRQAKKDGTLLAVLFLDLDRFKHVNDSRGHDTGDKLLKTVAQRISSTIRADDLVVRMGGDEFVVVMRGVTNLDEVRDAAARVIEALGTPMVLDGRTLVSTVSIGVACRTPQVSDTDRARALVVLGRAREAEQDARTAERLAGSWKCITSRSCTSTRSTWWHSRRSCAGSTRTTATFAPSASSRWRRKPASSFRSVTSSCSG